MHRPRTLPDALSTPKERRRLLTKIGDLRASTRLHVRRIEASRAQMELGLTSTMQTAERPPARSAEPRDVDIPGFGAGSKRALDSLVRESAIERKASRGPLTASS